MHRQLTVVASSSRGGGSTGESAASAVLISARSPVPWPVAGSGAVRRDAWVGGSGAPLGIAAVAGVAALCECCTRRSMRLLELG